MSIRSIIIARSSTDRHDVSCKSQIEEITAELKRRGEKIVKILEFPRKKYSDFLEDPDFKDILAEARRKDREWDKIWFYDTSRLSRNRMKAQTTKAFFKKHGIEIEFLKLPKTGEEALDNVMEGILETFDQLHSDFSRAGSIRGQKQNIRSGYRAGGFAPYGYRLKKHQLGHDLDNKPITKSTLEPHPENFPIVQEYLTRRAKGESRGSIIKDFQRRGIKSPSGKSLWLASSCHGIEDNLEVYCGHLVHNRHNRKIDGKFVGGKRLRPKAEWEIHRNAHQPAITAAQAEAIRQQRRKHQKTEAPKARTYLLTGLLECGECHGPMVGDSGFYTCIHKRKKVSGCSNSNISAGNIDKEALRFVKTQLLSRTHFQKVIEQTRRAYAEEIKRTQKNSARHQKRLDEIDQQIQRLLGLFERGNISPEIVEERVAGLESEKAGIKESMKGEQQVQTAIKYAEAELDAAIIREYTEQFEDLLSEENMTQMREFLATFIHRIELFPRKNRKRKGREVHIHGTIPALTRIEFVLPRGFEPLLPP